MEQQYSVSTRSFDLPLKAAIRTAAQLRFDGIRCDARSELKPWELSQTGIREFRKLLSEYGLRLNALDLTVHRSFYDPADLDARIAATRQAMELAAQLKTRSLCLKVGEIPSEESPDYAVLQQVIDDLARYGNHIGTILTIIPIGKSPEVMKAFLDSIRSGPVAIDFDPSRFLLGGQNPVEALRCLHSFIEQFTARDAVRDFSGGGHETQLGRGEVSWDETLVTLHEIGYRGVIHVLRTAGESRWEDLGNALSYLKAIAGEFG